MCAIGVSAASKAELKGLLPWRNLRSAGLRLGAAVLGSGTLNLVHHPASHHHAP